MKQTIIILIISNVNILICFQLKAELSAVNIREKGLGETSVAFTSFDNPSGISFAVSGFAYASYGNRFAMQELADINAGFVFPNKLVDVGLLLSRFGYEYYNENCINVLFSKRLTDYVALGLACGYYYIQVPDAEIRTNHINSKLGIQWKRFHNCTIGLSVSNFLIQSETKSRFPLKMQFGVSYNVSGNLLFCSELEKIKKDFVYKIGMEYRPVECVYFRAGAFGKPFAPTFGIGYKMNNLDFDLALSRHEVLGMSLAVGLTYNLKTK